MISACKICGARMRVYTEREFGLWSPQYRLWACCREYWHCYVDLPDDASTGLGESLS